MNSPRTSQQQSRIPFVTISICLTTLFLYVVYGPAASGLVYAREAIVQGESWRLLSGHFVHCDLNHLGWNLTAFAILGSLLEQRMERSKLLALIISCCFGVSAWLWCLQNTLHLYCGLSGMLNGMLSVLLVLMWQQQKHPLLLLVAGSALLKIVAESLGGQAIFTQTSWESVPGAHGAGFVTGLLYLFTTTALREVFSKTRCATAS